MAKDLYSRLIASDDKDRAVILDELRDAPGGKYGYFYTDAILEAIKKLESPRAKELARDALAGRMKRMTIKTIREYLKDDDNREVRLAAIKAVKIRNNVSYAVDVIPLLLDYDRGVAGAARETLVSLTDKDFGMSVERWRSWIEAKKDK